MRAAISFARPVPRLRGKAKSPEATAKLSLRPRARSVKPDPLETRREEALVQSTAAKLIMTRHRVEQMRDELVERDKSQAEVGVATTAIGEQLARATGLKSRRIVEAIAADLGDIEVEALRVTRKG